MQLVGKRRAEKAYLLLIEEHYWILSRVRSSAIRASIILAAALMHILEIISLETPESILTPPI